MAEKILARQSAAKIVENLGVSEGYIYLNGQVMQERDDTDVELPFRQESNFFYVTGVDEPDFHVVIDVSSKKVTLFAPDVNEEHVMWMGMPDSLEVLKEKYDVDDVKHVEKFLALNDLLAQAPIVYTLPRTNTAALNLDRVKVASAEDQKKLYAAFSESRAIKADWEIELLRKANKISSDAHVKLWQNASNSNNESDLYALFMYETARNGAFTQAYHPIMGVGKNAATLHYHQNNAPIKDRSELILVDAGAEYKCYASDITRTFPANGKFGPDAKDIYSIVLDMQEACLDKCKAGVPWKEIHDTATKVACQGLLRIGILKGSEEDVLKSHVVAAFFPHGIGHMIGLDVHDVAGYPEGTERIDEPGIRNLRMLRDLKAGFVVTVEPGIYFCEHLIKPALENVETAQFINEDKLNQYKSVGGVRIEDDIVITADGHINLTVVPKKIEDIESLMATGDDLTSNKRLKTENAS